MGREIINVRGVRGLDGMVISVRQLEPDWQRLQSWTMQIRNRKWSLESEPV